MERCTVRGKAECANNLAEGSGGKVVLRVDASCLEVDDLDKHIDELWDVLLGEALGVVGDH